MRQNVLTISNAGSVRLGYHAYRMLGKPKYVDIKVDVAGKRINIADAGGVGMYLVRSTEHPKTKAGESVGHVVYATDLRWMPKGSYDYVAEGVYQLRES